MTLLTPYCLSSPGPRRSSHRDVDAHEKSYRQLRSPFQGGSDGGQEGCPYAQTPWTGRQEYASSSCQTMRLRKAIAFLKAFPVIAYQPVYPRSLWFPPPGPWDVPATLCPSHPETGGPRPKGLESSASLTRGKADRDTCRQSTVPPAANKRAEAGTGSATEFQFTGGCGRGRGQPPP